ncbi:SLAIL protein, partial [Centropus bengalensis]|nr:SLAIL protein [Centropus bengalensis]
VGNLVLAGIGSSVQINEQNPSEPCGDLESLLKDADLDEVKVIELGYCPEEHDTWLYVSPRKPPADQKVDSPPKWCRQVLDNRGPETEVACRSLITRLDQGRAPEALLPQPLLRARGRAGEHGGPEVGGRCSEDTALPMRAINRINPPRFWFSLRQDCASSSASVSRRSSSASLHSLRRGTYSDQEFDTYSLEDEDDYDCSVSFRSAHRYSPSPLSSPRCQSPSSGADSGRAASSRIRPPRRSVPSPMPERLKYSNGEEELRHSMPNLARTGLRTLESVRGSRSLEADLQVPSSRIPRTQQRSAGLAPGKLRYPPAAGQSPLTARQPGKPGSCSGSPLTARQPGKACGYPGPASGARRPQGPSLGTSSSSCTPRSPSVVTVGKPSALRARPNAAGTPAPKSKATPASRR